MTTRKFFAPATLLFSAACGGVGYYLGQNIATRKFENKLKDQPRGISEVLKDQNTWRTQLHIFNNSDNTLNRHWAWVSIFQPRFTGTITYVVFSNTSNDKTYILQTIQKRVIDGIEKVVTEPPAGFYNGEYISSIPHVVAEDAERNIEKAFNLGKPIPASIAYTQAMDKFKKGQLPKHEYVKDKDSWQ